MVYPTLLALVIFQFTCFKSKFVFNALYIIFVIQITPFFLFRVIIIAQISSAKSIVMTKGNQINCKVTSQKELSAKGISLLNRNSLGICIGASTITIIKLVVPDDQRKIIIDKAIIRTNDGDPKATFEQLFSEMPFQGPAVVTGRKFRSRLNITSIYESEATESALKVYTTNGRRYSALVSLGAETFVVYELNKEGRISKLISKNQCASGTGEFFMQQIGRMGLTVDEAVQISSGSTPFKVSGRCSVFCKSDCTHALNKGIPKEQVTAGLALMIAEKAEELIKHISSKSPVMIVGGVTLNTAVIDFLKEKFDNIVVPDEACYFEALGAALYGLEHEVSNISTDKIEFSSGSGFNFHKPLSAFTHMVSFRDEEIHNPVGGEEYILGLDVGSTTTKGVIVSAADCKIVASEYLYTHGNPVKASTDVYKALLQQIPVGIKITGLGVTGSGRHISALHAGTRSVINEITAHAMASVYFDPEVDTIFEIGGQDAKFTYITNGVPADYAMNEACSAGTGSFIQEAAWESLHISLYDIEAAALGAQNPLDFRDQCAALIGSDIKSALQENHQKDDILGGLVYSICLNYINRVKAKRPVGKKILMQGGVCYNKAIPVAMAAITGKPIIVPPHPGLMGAFGTALKVREQISKGLIDKSAFNLKEIISRDFGSGKSFICKDKLNGCDRKCEISTFKINGKSIAFGGACNKYYDAFTNIVSDWQKNDFVKVRMDKIYNQGQNGKHATGTVGLNQTFTINRLFPLYNSFFNSLGYKVVLSDEVDKAGFDNQHSSFCYPVELAHGLFSNLISKKPDYIFMPEVYEMHVPGCEDDQKDSSATCIFVSKEINYLSQAFNYNEDRIIHPYLNFAKGYSSQEEVFISIASRLGSPKASNAKIHFRDSVAHQVRIENELHQIGETILKQLAENPDDIAIVLVGRDYNAFSEFANKGIPKKFASLGYKVIPYDLIDSSEEEIVNYQSWEAGKRIMRAAQTIKRHPQLFPVYISNYSCGPDSFLVPAFRKIMGNKPSLTLELDQHTADAGINTRIDAFIDVISNYHKNLYNSNGSATDDFTPAQIVTKGDRTVYIDSDGVELDMKDYRVKIVIPAIGDMAAALFSASLRSLGYNAVAMPEMDSRVLETGHKYASGKECLPVILLAGSLMTFIGDNKMNGSRLAFFNIGGTSACRIAQYPGFLSELVSSEKIRNVAMFTLISQDGYLGFSNGFLKRSIEAIILNDVLEDVRSGILSNANDSKAGLEFFYSEFANLVNTFSNDYNNLYTTLEIFSKKIAETVPFRTPVDESRYIALTGEIFIRHNQFAHQFLNHYFGKRGFILKDAYIAEWVKYLDYAWRHGVFTPKFTFRETLSRLIREHYITYVENKMQRILEATGYIKRHKTRVVNTIKHSLHILPLESTGEPALTLGTALAEGYEQYCGIINIGPFGCLQTRVGEAICSPNMNLGKKKKVKDNLGISYDIPAELDEDTEIPFLTIECDGKSFPQIIESRLETFVIQAERAAEKMKSIG